MWQHNKKCLPVEEIPVAKNVFIVNTTDENTIEVSNGIKRNSECNAAILVEIKKITEHKASVSTSFLVEVKKSHKHNIEYFSNKYD